MCLIVFAWNSHPKYKLIVAANRDEFYSRESTPAHFWNDRNNVLAGIDLQSGGTWMGINKYGCWSAITNYRDLRNIKVNAPSRGNLTADFLKNQFQPQVYIDKIKSQSSSYNGFNLLVGNQDEVCYLSNQLQDTQILKPGIYGLSNHILDSPWPKVEIAKHLMKNVLLENQGDIVPSKLLDLLYHTDIYPDEQLPDTGIGIEAERYLSSIFIKKEGYGTRCSTALILSNSGSVVFSERIYKNGEVAGNDSLFSFNISSS